ncbi:MAG: hypothetical protein MJA83_16725 [Gammaproteobacteria bacterium]|nr:hypothetical protein [Gammaproteobacteria bacterium]
MVHGHGKDGCVQKFPSRRESRVYAEVDALREKLVSAELKLAEVIQQSEKDKADLERKLLNAEAKIDYRDSEISRLKDLSRGSTDSAGYHFWNANLSLLRVILATQLQAGGMPSAYEAASAKFHQVITSQNTDPNLIPDWMKKELGLKE